MDDEDLRLELCRLDTLISVAKTGKESLIREKRISESVRVWESIEKMATQHVQFLHTRRG